MSKALEIATQILQAEEIARRTPKYEKSEVTKNNIYETVEIDLTVAHDSYTVVKPRYMKNITFIKTFPSDTEYQYSINYGDWIIVPAGSTISEDSFIIESLRIKNDAGTGTLGIYLEGENAINSK